MAGKKYIVNTACNFSIGDEEFYLSRGQEVELPDHALIEALENRGHLTKVAVKAETKKASNDKK